MNIPPSLNLVGAGRVGQTLASMWTRQNTFAVQDVLTTSLASAQAACHTIGAGHAMPAIESMHAADIWMLCVSDAQIATVAARLAHVQQGKPPAIAFHCSGALNTEALRPLSEMGWAVASAHCILSFASVPAALAQFSGTPCALEGDAQAAQLLRPAFSTIGAQCFDVRSEDKLLYHAAAVFATNFLPVLQSVAEDLWHATGVPDALIAQLRTALLHNAVANITALGPCGALTGPAARGDTEAIARQGLAVAAWQPEAGKAYNALSALALQLTQRKNHAD